MKKLFNLGFAVCMLFVGLVSMNSLHALDIYDSSNLTAPNGGGFTYEDHSLSDGWYDLVIDNAAVTNPAGYLTVSYWTGNCSVGYNFHDSDYVEEYDTTSDYEARIYIQDGKFIFNMSEFNTYDTTTLETGISLELIELNELDEDYLTVTSASLVYDSDLLDGWYRLKMVDSLTVPENYLDPQYYTDDFSEGSNFFTSDLVSNIDTSTSGEIKADIYIKNGQFKIDSFDGYDVTLGNVTNINLTLIELDTVPTFNYTELTLDVPYYDIPTLNEVKAMLTATDDQDGDLTSSITLFEENITNFESGDEMVSYEYIEIPQSPIAINITLDELHNSYDLYLKESGSEEYILVSETSDYATIGLYETVLVESGSEGVKVYFNSYPLPFLHFTDNGDSLTYASNSSGFENGETYYLKSNEEVLNYYATYSVEDSRGNTSYLTVNYDLYDDMLGTLSYSDDLNNINQDFYEGDSFVLNLNVLSSDYNESFIDDLFDSMTFNSDYSDIKLDGNWESGAQMSWYIQGSNFDYEDSNPMTYAFIFIHQYQDELDEYEMELEVYITLIDNVKPSFETTPNYLYVSNSAEITTTQLESYIVKSDNATSEANLTVALLSNGYTANKTIDGRYEVVYSLEDEVGNLNYHTFVIFVVDLNPPVYSFPETFTVGTYENAPITEDDLTDVLEAYGIVVTELGYTVTIIEDDYLDNSTTRGDYTMRLLITYDDETSETIELNFEVVAEPVPLVIPGTAVITPSTGPAEWFGITWYWWFSIPAAIVLSSKKGRKALGFRK